MVQLILQEPDNITIRQYKRFGTYFPICIQEEQHNFCRKNVNPKTYIPLNLNINNIIEITRQYNLVNLFHDRWYGRLNLNSVNINHSWPSKWRLRSSYLLIFIIIIMQYVITYQAITMYIVDSFCLVIFDVNHQTTSKV